ncbi:hypothetical protein HBB16_09445 [Pseudonocardia sp. MCCB 268]|nr:hypothetical protein [Pseudonocardia cytotoxica]
MIESVRRAAPRSAPHHRAVGRDRAGSRPGRGGLYLAWTAPAQDTGPEPPGNTVPPAHAGASPGAAPAAPERDPLATARRWLETTRTVTFDDPSPVSWTDRVAPLLTGPAAAERGHRRGKRDRCWLAADGRQPLQHRGQRRRAVVPPEAPRTEHQVYVQVTGTVRTGCAARQPAVPRRQPPRP